MAIIKNEHTGNRTLVSGPEIPCTTTMLCALANILIPSPYKCVFCTILTFFTWSLILIFQVFKSIKFKKLWNKKNVRITKRNTNKSGILGFVFGLNFVAPLVNSGSKNIGEFLITVDVRLDFGKEGGKFFFLLFGNWNAFA